MAGAFQPPPVAFMTELTQSMSGVNYPLIFDKVTINEGNAYNTLHGNFVAPYNGTYLFTVTSCAVGGHFNTLDILVDGTTFGSVRCGDTNYHECSTKVFIKALTAGDDVYIRHQNYGDSIYASSIEGYPVFGGALLHTH
ncbi:HIP-like protein [Mya arenaria]|uniref:HIP-like protein n=1 Tax=Mya arenaria TaxID=6604 RepID=A0ABY7EE16_MYAAR|nr:HIP-like protein [Mya arenaria]